jgi:hypothetical protein
LVSIREIELKVLAKSVEDETRIVQYIADIIIHSPDSIFELSVKRAEEVAENKQG